MSFTLQKKCTPLCVVEYCPSQTPSIAMLELLFKVAYYIFSFTLQKKRTPSIAMPELLLKDVSVKMF